jgi:hypothetical protein
MGDSKVTTIFEWVDEDCTNTSSKIDVLYFQDLIM